MLSVGWSSSCRAVRVRLVCSLFSLRALHVSALTVVSGMSVSCICVPLYSTPSGGWEIDGSQKGAGVWLFYVKELVFKLFFEKSAGVELLPKKSWCSSSFRKRAGVQAPSGKELVFKLFCCSNLENKFTELPYGKELVSSSSSKKLVFKGKTESKENRVHYQASS